MLDLEKIGLYGSNEDLSQDFEEEKKEETETYDESDDDFESYIVPNNAEEVSYKKIGEAKIVVYWIGSRYSNIARQYAV